MLLDIEVRSRWHLGSSFVETVGDDSGGGFVDDTKDVPLETLKNGAKSDPVRRQKVNPWDLPTLEYI